jgi:hypothetical protein
MRQKYESPLQTGMYPLIKPHRLLAGMRQKYESPYQTGMYQKI